MGNIIKDTIDRRLATLVCEEKQLDHMIECCEKELEQNLQKKWTSRKKLTIILITVIGIFSLLGAGIYYQSKTYRFDGTADQDQAKYRIDNLARTLEEYSASSTKTSASMSDLAESASNRESSWKEITLQFLENGARSSQNPYHVESMEAVIKILEESKNKLSYPTYIPEGYSFAGASLNTYISPDMMMLEPIESSISNGVITETYLMPDSMVQNIESIYIQYKNKNGDHLDYNMNLANNDDLGFGASGDARAQTLTETGFEKGVLIREPDKDTYGYSIIGYFLNPIETIDYIFPTGLGLEYRYHRYESERAKIEVNNLGLEETINSHIEQYHYVMYNISGDSLSEEELLKMVKSLK